MIFYAAAAQNSGAVTSHFIALNDAYCQGKLRQLHYWVKSPTLKNSHTSLELSLKESRLLVLARTESFIAFFPLH